MSSTWAVGRLVRNFRMHTAAAVGTSGRVTKLPGVGDVRLGDPPTSLLHGATEASPTKTSTLRKHLMGSTPRTELSGGFPNVMVANLCNEKFQIQEKLLNAPATVLLVSRPQSSRDGGKDWSIPFKRQFVDHADVQVLELTVNSTLLELLMSKWTRQNLQKQTHEKRFDDHLIYNGRLEAVERLLADREDGFALLLDRRGRIRWSGGRLSGIKDLNNFNNAVLKTLQDAQIQQTPDNFQVCPSQRGAV